MSKYSCGNKACIVKPVPKTVDTVRFNNHYINLETVKEKATGILSAVAIVSGIVAFSFLFFL